MSNSDMFVNVRLVNDKVKFLGESSLQPGEELAIDYVPPLGDGEGYLGLEMLLMSFAGCVSTALVALLRRMGQDPSGFRMKAIAYRSENPVKLDKIEAAFTAGAAITAEAAQKAIEMAARISPVWLAIQNNVEVVLEYREEL